MESTKKTPATPAPNATGDQISDLMFRSKPFADKLIDLLAEQDQINIDDIDLMTSLATQLQENIKEAFLLSQGYNKTWERGEA